MKMSFYDFAHDCHVHTPVPSARWLLNSSSIPNQLRHPASVQPLAKPLDVPFRVVYVD